MGKARAVLSLEGRVCVVGAVNADLLIQVSPEPSTPGYAVATGFSTLAGGKGLNTALNMAALAPSRVGFVGRVGNDLYGDFLEGIVAKSPLEVASIVRDKSAHTGIGHVRVRPDGEYDTVVLPGANAGIGAEDIEAYSSMHPAILGWVSNLETPLTWLSRARVLHPKTPLAINLSPLNADVDRALELSNVIVLNALEAREVTGSSSTETVRALLTKMRKLTKATVVITAGEEGAEALSSSDEFLSVDAHPVDVVTTVGAGDAFFATLSLAVNLGVSLEDSLSLAAEAGSLVASSNENFLTQVSAHSLARRFNEYLSPAGIR